MGKTKKNIIYNLTYQILILIIPLITAPYLSRVLGVDGVGSYSYVQSVSYYFYIIILSGLSNYGNRAIAKVKDDRKAISKTFWSIYLMQLITGIFVIIAYCIYIALFADRAYRTFFIAFSPYILSAVIDINWLFLA